MEELPLRIETDDLAPRPEAGVDGQQPLLTQWRREQKLPKVVGKDADRLQVGPLLRRLADFGFHRSAQQTLVGVFNRGPDLLRRGMVPPDKHCGQQRDRLRLRRNHAQRQEFLLLSAPHREDAVGRRLGRRLVPLEIVPVPAPLRLLSGDDPGLKVRLRRKELPHPGAGLLVFVHPFGDDVPRAGQRLVR